MGNVWKHCLQLCGVPGSYSGMVEVLDTIAWHSCMSQLYGTPAWQNRMAQLHGTLHDSTVWHCCMAQLHSIVARQFCSPHLHGTAALSGLLTGPLRTTIAARRSASSIQHSSSLVPNSHFNSDVKSVTSSALLAVMATAMSASSARDGA